MTAREVMKEAMKRYGLSDSEIEKSMQTALRELPTNTNIEVPAGTEEENIKAFMDLLKLVDTAKGQSAVKRLLQQSRENRVKRAAAN